MTTQTQRQGRRTRHGQAGRVGPVGAYTVHLADGTLAGRADFVDAPEADGERIFFHTEVDESSAVEVWAKLLVREALADSIRRNLTVVPVCPLFAAHLQELGLGSWPTAVGSGSRPAPTSRSSRAR
jgi:uncharacterized protein